MNCKPGDLARVYGLPSSCDGGNDRIVKLKDCPPFIEDGEPCWWLEEPVRFEMSHSARRLDGLVFLPGDGVRFDHCPDKHLRPIRGLPGTDEILLKAGKPKANDLAPKPQREFAR